MPGAISRTTGSATRWNSFQSPFCRQGSVQPLSVDDANAKRLAPGQSEHLIWKFSKAGTFEFACLIPGHYEAGMHGLIKVE